MTKDIRKPASLTRHDSDDVSYRSVDLNRREFMARSALLGVTAGAAGFGLHSGAAWAQAQRAKSVTLPQGIIYADPKNLSTNVPLSKVLEISEFLNAPENRFQIQFPSDKTQFAWVNMSRYYQTAQIRRSGAISELGYHIDPAHRRHYLSKCQRQDAHGQFSF
jgi:hypothetical protein